MAMVCPVDGTELKMSERQGVEIDYCPQCRGVWLDRGELDKIIDRTEQPAEQPAAYEPRRSPGFYRDDDDDDLRHKGRRKKKGWMGDMFDFGD